MKNNVDMKWAGFAEIDAKEAKQINGGGIIDETWWGFWNGVLGLMDQITGPDKTLQNLLMGIVGHPPQRP